MISQVVTFSVTYVEGIESISPTQQLTWSQIEAAIYNLPALNSVLDSYGRVC